MDIESILLISDDDRVRRLVDCFQPQLISKLSLVADFSRGFKQVLESRPAAVFIQHRISGVLGETVAVQLKVLLRDGLPRLILLNESSAPVKVSTGLFDEKIDLFIDEVELHRQFTRLLENLPSVQWRNRLEVEQSCEFIDAFDFSSNDEIVDLSCFDKKDDSSENLAENESAANDTPKDDTPKVVQQTDSYSDESVEDALNALSKAYEDVAPKSSEPDIGKEPDWHFDDDEPMVEATKPATVEVMPFDVQSVSPWRHRMILAVSICLILALSLWCWKSPYIRGQFDRMRPDWAVLNKEKSTASKHVAVLPALIPLSGIDANYGKARPGWERYVAGDADFLIYREHEKIRALQMISKSAVGIQPAEIEIVLRDLTGSGSYNIKNRQEQDGYQLESGALKTRGEVLLYRQKQSGIIKAIVVEP